MWFKENPLNRPPNRIISTVPSQTELLFYFGLDQKVIGVTKFCIHPESWHKQKTKIGGTKNLNINKIKALQPDFILANKEENSREDIELLAKYFPVYITQPTTLEEAFHEIVNIATIVGKEKEGEDLVHRIQKGFKEINQLSKSIKVAYFIWKKPYMTIGGDTFIHDVLTYCGFDNIFKEKKRYPEVESLKNLKGKVDFIFLSSEPYPFSEKHIVEFSSIAPVVLVDGEMFSWYGSRLLKASKYFIHFMNTFSKDKV